MEKIVEEVEVQVTANAKMPEYSTNTLNVKISVQYFNLLIIQQQIYLNLPACFLYLHMHICSHFVTLQGCNCSGPLAVLTIVSGGASFFYLSKVVLIQGPSVPYICTNYRRSIKEVGGPFKVVIVQGLGCTDRCDT